jgi:hypothetical protein
MPMGMPYPKGKMSMSKMMGVESVKDKMPMKAEKADMKKGAKKMPAFMMKGKKK